MTCPAVPTTLDDTTTIPQPQPVAIMADNKPTSASDLLNGSAAAKTPEDIAKENDLLPKLVTHLDRHLIFPLLQFADQEDGSSTSADLLKAKFELLGKTNMTDYVAELYKQIEGVDEAPKEFLTKRQEVLDRLAEYEKESEKITDLLGREDVITNLRSDKVANLEYLKKDHDVRFRSEGVGIFIF